MLIFFALAVVIAMLACVFALQNATPITVTLITMEVQASLALVLLATFALGALGALLACTPAMVKGRLKLYDLKKKISALEGDPEPAPAGEETASAEESAKRDDTPGPDAPGASGPADPAPPTSKID